MSNIDTIVSWFERRARNRRTWLIVGLLIGWLRIIEWSRRNTAWASASRHGGIMPRRWRWEMAGLMWRHRYTNIRGDGEDA